VTEAFSEEQDEFYGEERLVQLVQASFADSAQHMLDLIIVSVDEFAGRTPQSDDLTGVVIRRTESKTSGAA